MLALLSTLQTGRAWGGDDLARRMEVSPRTLRRDVDRLRSYGYPVETQPGPGGYYRLTAGSNVPPLVLDDDEAVASLLALAALAAAGPADDGGVSDAAQRVYARLEDYLPARLRPRLAAIRASLEASEQAAPVVRPDQFTALADAIGRRQVVEFGYTDAQGNETRRAAEPHRILHHLMRWYLLAWDVGRADWRLYRLDRMHALRATTKGFGLRPLPAETALAYLREGLRVGTQRVTITVDAPPERVVDLLRYQDARIDPLGDERTRVSLDLDSWRWLPHLLAGLDAPFSVDAPTPVLEACATFAERLQAAMSASRARLTSPPSAASAAHQGAPAELDA